MKVRDYVKNTTNPFITSAMIDADDPIRNTTFQSGLADFIRINHGALKIRKSIMLETEGEPANWIQWACSNLYIVNKYKYDHLYATTVAQYDPIENYHMVEEESVDTTNTKSGTFQKGSQSNTVAGSNVYGAHTDTTNVIDLQGERTDTHSSTETVGTKTDTLTDRNEYGAESETDNLAKIHGAKTESHNRTLTYTTHNETTDNGADGGSVVNGHSVAPYDSDVLHAESQDTLGATRKTYSGHTDTDNLTDSLATSYTDNDNRSISKQSHTDTLAHTNVYGGQQNANATTDISGSQRNTSENTFAYGSKTDTTSETVTEGQRSDSTSESETGDVDRTLTRSGNIGVTTTQQMLESERQLAMFNLYAVVAKDIIGCIANRCYGGC